MIFNENKPYIFFSYPHRNNNASRVIQVLRNDGYNVWNDEGIKHASLYDDVIASHVEGCKVFLAYITREYLESDYCISEIKYALEKNKPIVIVLEHEKDLKLVEKYQNGLYMRISKIQALIHDRFATEDSFNRAICSTEAFNKCKINQNKTTLTDIFTPKASKEKQVKRVVLVATLMLALVLFICVAIPLFRDTDNPEKLKKPENPGEPPSQSGQEGGVPDQNTDKEGEEKEALYALASSYYDNQEYGKAAIAFAKCGNFRNSQLLSDRCWSYLKQYLHTTMTTELNYYGLLWIDEDGNAKYTYDDFESEYSTTETLELTNLVSIAFSDGIAIGLKEDGTVEIWCGESYYFDVSAWYDIVSVDAGDGYVVGLRKDGTVVASGNNDNGQCNVGAWEDIVSIRSIPLWGGCTLGIKTDGTIVMAGDCEKPLDSEDDSHMYLDEVKNVLENIDNAHHFSSTWWYIIDNDGKIISIVPSLFPDYPEFKDVEDIVYSFDEHDHIYILAAGTIRPIKLEDGNPCTESCYVCQEMFLPDTYVGLAITNTDLITLNYRGIIESHSTYESGFKIIKFPENTRCKLP